MNAGVRGVEWSAWPALILWAAGCAGGPDPAFLGVRASQPTGAHAIADDALVAAYDMSTLLEDGRLRDFGPHGLHGTFTGARMVSSPSGEARDFSEVAFRVDLPEAPAFDLDGPLTIAAWIRMAAGSLHQHIVACDDKWALWITPDDRYRLGDTRGGGWSTPPGSLKIGEWTAIVAVLSARRGDELTPETAAIYLNGERMAAERHMRTADAQARTTWGPEDLYPTDACYIGFESHQGNEAHQSMALAGAVDELVISARAWSGHEVRAFSAAPRSPASGPR